MERREHFMIFTPLVLFGIIIVIHLFITYNSSQHGQASAERSEQSLDFITTLQLPYQLKNILKRTLHRTLPFWSSLYPTLHSCSNKSFAHFLVRKAAHMTQFFFLGLTWFSFLSFFSLEFYNIIIYSCCIVLFSSVIDEFYQHFIPNRSSSVIDVLVDFSGGFIAIIIASIIYFFTH